MSATRAAVHQPAASGAAPEHAAGDAISIVKLVNRRTHVAVTWGDGHLSRFHAVWLRDNCHCAACRDPQTGQRLIDIATLPDDILIDSSAAGAELSLTFTPEAHRGRIPSAWLRAHCYATESRHARLAQPRLWDSQISNTLPEADHAEVIAIRASLGLWLALIQTYGFALLRGVPLEDGQVVSIAALFGFVRETNYGRFFDVRTKPTANNLAFTGHALGAHTDNPYRDPVPGLQLLHCLEAGAEGGESVLVDGFHAAELLRRRAPEQFALLSRYEVPFRFSDAECDLRARGPLIEFDHDGVVSAVRYNNRSADALDLPTDIVPDFYEAYRHFGRLLGRPDGLAASSGAPEPLVVAALLHDIGHLVEAEASESDWHRRHDAVGGAYLVRWFGPAVSAPARLHVEAKRYLCAVEPDYGRNPSPASLHTLALQGGPMDTTQIREFESQPQASDAVMLRRWDDAAKVPDRSAAEFGDYRRLIESLAVV